MAVARSLRPLPRLALARRNRCGFWNSHWERREALPIFLPVTPDRANDFRSAGRTEDFGFYLATLGMDMLAGTPDHPIVRINPKTVHEGPIGPLAPAGFIHPCCGHGLTENVDLLPANQMGAARDKHTIETKLRKIFQPDAGEGSPRRGSRRRHGRIAHRKSGQVMAKAHGAHNPSIARDDHRV